MFRRFSTSVIRRSMAASRSMMTNSARSTLGKAFLIRLREIVERSEEPRLGVVDGLEKFFPKCPLGFVDCLADCLKQFVPQCIEVRFGRRFLAVVHGAPWR